MLPADSVAHGLEFGLRGNAAAMEKEAPGAKERADSNVECAIGDATPVEGPLEEVEGFGVGDEGCGAGVAADAGEFTGGTVVAQKGFEPVDLIKGEVHVLFGRELIGGVEVDGEDGAHSGVSLMEAPKRGLGA